MMLGARDTGRDMSVYEIVPAIKGDKAIGGCKINTLNPFSFAGDMLLLR
jgi:hypothetical protein